jgi:hypothetical protein
MDEELWETVAIYKSDILQCAFHGRLLNPKTLIWGFQ